MNRGKGTAFFLVSHANKAFFRPVPSGFSRLPPDRASMHPLPRPPPILKSRTRIPIVLFVYSGIFLYLCRILTRQRILMKPVKNPAYALMVVLLMAAAASVTHGCQTNDAPENTSVTDTLPLVLRVNRTSRLYTSEYRIHKIVTHDDVVRLKGTVFNQSFNWRIPLGDRKTALPLDVTLKAYIDFDGFGERNIERRGDRIRIILPDPRVVVTSSKINHRQVKQYIDLTRTRYTDAELTDFARQGVESILHTLPDIGILESARLNAAHLLIPLVCDLGYKEENIVISFRKDFTAADVPQLLDPESARTLSTTRP